ncbi:MAG: hypothetical protein ABIO70_18865 [Pseudomonadota bacterium]
MRRILALLLLSLAVPAFAQEPPVYGRERFVEAIRAYRAGEHARAVQGLTALLIDPRVQNRDLRISARVYLGEILLSDGNQQAAWDAFRVILVDEPDHHLDPYEHPPDVVEFFETVRAATIAMGPDAPPPGPEPEPPEIRPLPTGAYLGFGLHQLRQGRILAGSLLAAGEVGLLAGTFATGIPLYLDHETYDEAHEYPALKRARALNWSLGGAFAVLWAVGVSEASLQWRSDEHKKLEDWQKAHATSELSLSPTGARWEVRF